VQSGDTPGAIAAKLGVPAAQQTAWVTQLLQTNNVTAQTLQIGQTLTLPPIPR
jgi:LysM repeat protein